MRKLAWFSVGFAAACLWACYFAPDALPAAMAAGMLVLFFAVWLAVRPKPGDSPVLLRRPREKGRYALYQFARRGAALALGAVVAFGWAAAYDAVFRAPAESWTGDEVFLSGEAVSYPAPTSIGGYSVTVRLDGGFTAPDILVYGTADWDGITPGDRVSCTARVTSSTRAHGGETTYYTAKGVYLLGYCSGPPEVEKAERISIRHWPALCARALKEGICAAFDETAAPIAAAVTLGGKTGLDDTLYSAFSRAGLMHAAAVSGLHISFLVGVVMALSGKSRRAALGILPLLIFYALMAGGTPSAFRAVIMQCALLFAPIARREGDGPSALAFALLILLIQNPFAAASVGLQLSFASVAGILLVTGPLLRRVEKPLKKRRPPKSQRLKLALWKGLRAAVSGAAASLGAMLFTVPLTALYFGQILLLSPLSNVLVLWALSLLMVCALVLGVVGIFLPAPAAVLGTAAGLLAHYARWMALLLGKFPFASLGADNIYCLIWLGAAYLTLAAACLGKNKVKQPLIPLCGLTLLLCAAIGLGRWETDRADLTVTALNVGQGSSTALISGGKTALVDCGGSGSRSAGDTAADCFAAQGRTRLDVLVLTHFDSDHLNGVEQLFYRMEVDTLAVPAESLDDPGATWVLELAAAEGAKVIFVDETVELPLGNAALTLFPPLGGGMSNESGLFVLCSYGEFDALVTGDADAFVEKMLIKYYPIPDIELLLAGHHGSKNSSCDEFLRAAAPEIAVISAGVGNPYGHPAAETLDRLDALGAEIHRTDLEGTVTVRVQAGKVGIY